MSYKVEKDYINNRYREEWINELKSDDIIMEYQSHIFILPTKKASGKTTCLPSIIMNYRHWNIPPKNEVLYLHEISIWDKMKIYNHLPTGKHYSGMINIKELILKEIEQYQMCNPMVEFNENL